MEEFQKLSDAELWVASDCREKNQSPPVASPHICYPVSIWQPYTRPGNKGTEDELEISGWKRPKYSIHG